MMGDVASHRDLRELVHEAFRRSGLVRGVQRAAAVVAWRDVAGPDVARFASAVALQQGTLVVDVPDPETAMHLGLQRHHLLRAYERRLGRDVVRDIRFRVGRAATPASAEPPSAPTVHADPRAVAALARALQDVPETVAAPALQAGAALLTLQARRTAAGWRPCAVCAVPCEGDDASGRGWCATCRRQASLPKVERGAEALVADPDAATDALSADERRVARALARAMAAERALATLPHALADPTARPLLDRLARVQAALAADVPLAAVDDDHLQVVDARVLRALGRWARPTSPLQEGPH